jgi:hypothetical protein
VSAWPSFCSAPEQDINSKAKPLEPVWLEECPSIKFFPDKRPLAELPNKKVILLMLFYVKNSLRSFEWPTTCFISKKTLFVSKLCDNINKNK